MDAQTVLVIVLAIALAIFLILAIVLSVMLIRVTKQVRHITDQAEQVTDNFVSVSRVIKKSLRPAVISSALTHALKKFTNKPKPKKNRR